MKRPKISVIIPAYNEENEIEKTLNCVLNQTYQDFEIIVSNDGSTDKTREIVEKFMKKDKRIKIISSKTGHSGAYARNKGATIAKGKIFIFLDADARISKNFLKVVEEGFRKFDVQGLVHPKKDTYTNFLSKTIALMARNNRKIAKKIGKKVLRKRNEFSIFIFKRDAFYKIGKYDDSVLYYDDSDITNRFYSKNYKALMEPRIMLYSAQPDSFSEFYRRYKWSGEGIAAMKNVKNKIKEISYLLLKFLLIIIPFLVLIIDFNIGILLIVFSLLVTYLFNLRTNKNIIWSFLMIPITYLKNIIEFGSMIWHGLFPRKNVRD